jgi:citrate synthase
LIDSINLNSWITQEEACEVLGVRKQTLYAYASRGQIEVRGDPAHANRKLYRGTDISVLLDKRKLGRARKTIAASTMAWGEPIVNTHISTIVRGRLYYRGKDAVQLSQHATLEEVAGLLWDSRVLPAFPSFVAAQGVGGSGNGNGNGSGGTTQARVYSAMAHAAAEGRSAYGLSIVEMCNQAAMLVGQLASGFIDLPTGEEALHLRIAPAWKADAHADLLRRVLVLMADQELTTSAFAARVTASTGASLGACALTGLAALSGPLHGAAYLQVGALLDEAKQVGTEDAVNNWMAIDTPLPGFGHQLYPEGDPRAIALFKAFHPPENVKDLIECVARLTGLKPTIDVALAALVERCGLPDGAAFALFAIGRSVGWMAHSVEQCSSGSLLRPRANYIGTAIEASVA